MKSVSIELHKQPISIWTLDQQRRIVDRRRFLCSQPDRIPAADRIASNTTNELCIMNWLPKCVLTRTAGSAARTSMTSLTGTKRPEIAHCIVPNDRRFVQHGSLHAVMSMRHRARRVCSARGEYHTRRSSEETPHGAAGRLVMPSQSDFGQGLGSALGYSKSLMPQDGCSPGRCEWSARQTRSVNASPNRIMERSAATPARTSLGRRRRYRVVESPT